MCFNWCGRSYSVTVPMSPLIKEMMKDDKIARKLVLGKKPFTIEFKGKKYKVT